MSEDKIDRCGWKWLTLFRNPKDDPYLPACEIHDAETSTNSVAEQISTLEEVQKRFEGNVDRIREARYSGIGMYRILGSFYKVVTRVATRWFWEGK